MNRETLREDIRKGDGIIPEPKGNGRWKKFLEDLAQSTTITEVAKLVCQCPKMTSQVFDERLSHVTNQDVLIPFQTAPIQVNIVRCGYEPRREEVALLAVDQAMTITKCKNVPKIKGILSKEVREQEQLLMMQRSCYARA